MNSGLMGAGSQNRSMGNMLSDRQSACGPQMAQTPLPSSYVENSLSVMNSAIDMIQALTHDLEKRLSPVSAPYPECEPSDNACLSSSQCDLERRIDSATRMLNGTVSQLHSMIDALRI